MRRRNTRAKESPAKSAKIIRLPHDDFSFKPYEFQDSELTQRYDSDRVMVEILDGLLRMDAATMKAKVHLMPSVVKNLETGDLIHDLNACSDSFGALAELFACAAACLTVVNAKLV